MGQISGLLRDQWTRMYALDGRWELTLSGLKVTVIVSVRVSIERVGSRQLRAAWPSFGPTI